MDVPSEPLTSALTAAVAVLIIACAMGLAVPTAVMVASGRGASAGVLIKGGEPLERLASVARGRQDRHVDAGAPQVVDFQLIAGDREPVIGLVAAVEARSEHPLAKAIAAYRGGDSQLKPGLQRWDRRQLQAAAGRRVGNR